MWHVTIRRSKCPIEQYQQVVRLQNVRHGRSIYEKVLLLDLFMKHRMDYDGMKKTAAKVRLKEVAKACDEHVP